MTNTLIPIDPDRRTAPPRDDVADRPRPGAGSVLIWASWFGLLAGAAELAVFLLKCQWLDPRNLNVGRHYPWMFPASGLLILAGPGLALAVATKLKIRFVSPTVVLAGLLFPAYLGLLFRGPIFTVVCLLLAAALAYRTARFLAGRLDRFDRVARIGLVVTAGLFGITVAACFGREGWADHRSRSGPVAAGSKNVILVVLDTVRAQSLGLYGYGRDTSPNLARLAGRGVRFDRAYSTAPWTAPSHASLFTGRWPHELGVAWDRPLDRSSPTLAEVLAARGYATAGFVANTTYCSYETGLDRGFAHYEDYDVTPRAILQCSSLVQRSLNFVHNHPGVARALGESGRSSGDRKDAARINRDFLGWLGKRDESRPFFAFLNYFDAHHPYFEPEGGPEFGREPQTPSDFRVLQTWWERDKRQVKPADIELAVDAYDRCIASLDDQIGRLFDELEHRGTLKDTLVVLTSDHGEHLGERRLFGHGCSLYRPELHVPLIVIDPGSGLEGKVVDRPVSLRDLPSTVLDRLGMSSQFSGRSLARTWSGAEMGDDLVISEVVEAPEDDPNRGESPARRGPLVSMIDRDHHYIRDAQGREELFDVRLDPLEERDVAGRPESAPILGRFRSEVAGIPRRSRVR